MLITLQRCCKCKKVKHDYEFSNPRSWWCRECERERDEARRQTPEYKAYQKTYQAQYRRKAGKKVGQ